MSSVALQRSLEGEVSDALHKANAHLREFEALRTYPAVSLWQRAEQAVTALTTAALQVSMAAERLSQQAGQLHAARMRRFFVVRWFISTAPEFAKRSDATKARLVWQALQDALAKLRERIAYTPTDEKNRRALLKALRLDRKALSLEKRNVNAKKRKVHRGAKEAAAVAGKARGLFGEYHDPSLAADQRRAIREDRYAKLAPYEDEWNATERQLCDVDRRLIWVERFGCDSDDK